MDCESLFCVNPNGPGFWLIFKVLFILLVFIPFFSTAVKECDMLYINSDTTLKEDYLLEKPTKYCFVINKSDIILDCGGHTIYTTTYDDEIAAIDLKRGLKNIKIKNCKFNGLNRAIYGKKVNGLEIYESNFLDCG